MGDDDEILHDVFHAYANVPGGRMTNAAFRRLTFDAPHLITPWFTTVDVDLVYAQASGPLRQHLDVAAFAEALVLLAWRKFPEEAQKEAFQRLLHENIFLLPAAPKMAHARAAEFAVRRLSLSANYRPSNVDPIASLDLRSEPDPFSPLNESCEPQDTDNIVVSEAGIKEERREWAHSVAARFISLFLHRQEANGRTEAARVVRQRQW
ncbi:hypothetical protein ACHHYP_05384 [Achlya hypogyna]|uniref:Uncharacterized protein n=1 Tax=Achlya hypogyna TaxID=1202772 RepID=A0A1V9YY02_ACHHY|nr:hypothetical protein ACHHYP_05384 [Achlya hypogyna]